MDSNIDRIKSLAEQIGTCISDEAKANQARLFDARVSLTSMIEVQENSMMSPQQRTAIKEAADMVKQALSKVESAWTLRPLDAAPLSEQDTKIHLAA